MRTVTAAILAAALLGAPAGCQPTPERIATWKGTQKGPGKLRELAQDEAADPRLRALAIAALVEIGEGFSARDLAGTAPAAKGAIAREAVAPLAALLGPSLDGPVPTTPAQRAAKDALFVLRADAAPPDRARIDALLVKWIAADLAARASQGGESSEKILLAIGASAASALVPIAQPGPNLVEAARLLGELGDRDAAQRAAAPLVAGARAASGNVPEPVLVAIGLLGSAPATAFLLELAQHGPVDGRKRALYALAQGRLSAGDEKALAGALAIAADARADGGVREAAFQVIEKVGPAAVGGCVRLFRDPNTTVRFRAVEAALKAGGAGAIARVLPALPEDRPITSEDLDSLVVHDLDLLGKEAMPALAEAARHPPALGQIAALRALARRGGPKEAQVAAGLAAETTVCGVLRPPSNVGDEARRAQAAIERRR